MAFEGLKARIQAQQAEMHSQQYIDRMVTNAQSIIGSNAPIGEFGPSGTMMRNLTTATPVIPTSDGFHAGLGDRGLVGHEAHSAPPGTIKAFLDDNDEFKIGRETEEEGGWPKNKDGAGFVFDSTMAWAYLSETAKQVLQSERSEGRYGGTDEGVGAGMSSYFFQQEGSLDDWKRGAAGAHITPDPFLERSMEEWRAELPQILQGLRISLGM